MLARAAHFQERELPEHALFCFVETLSSCRHAPEAHVLPLAYAKLVEEGHGVAAFDGCEQRSIRRVQVLISVPPVARVKNRIARFIHTVGVAGVDATEICEQRNEATVALVDTVSYAMREIDFSPRENFRSRESSARASRLLTRRRALKFSRLPGRHAYRF